MENPPAKNVWEIVLSAAILLLKLIVSQYLINGPSRELPRDKVFDVKYVGRFLGANGIPELCVERYHLHAPRNLTWLRKIILCGTCCFTFLQLNTAEYSHALKSNIYIYTIENCPVFKDLIGILAYCNEKNSVNLCVLMDGLVKRNKTFRLL